MKTRFNYTLTILAIFLCHISLGQKVTNNNKETGVPTKPVRLKDTTIFEIITQTKDTFSFGSDKKTKIKEAEINVSNSLRINNKSLDILFRGNGTLLMTLNLELITQRNDTIPVYSIFDPTMIVRLYIIKLYTCDIKGFQINNYNKVQQYAYHKRLLTKLVDFKTAD